MRGEHPSNAIHTERNFQGLKRAGYKVGLVASSAYFEAPIIHNQLKVVIILKQIYFGCFKDSVEALNGRSFKIGCH